MHYPFFRVAGLAVAAGLIALALVVRPAWTGPADGGHEAGGLDAGRVVETLGAGRTAASVMAYSVAVRDRSGAVTVQAAGPRLGPFDRRPVSPDTPFEAASLSKPVTAWAVLRLASRGEIDLDAPVEGDFGDFTLRDVLQHAGGFDNALGAEPAPVRPAGGFAYAGTGYLYLAEAIEAATGQSFATHMNTVVLPELGMTHSRFGAGDDAPALARPAMDAGIIAAMALLVAACVLLPFALVAGVVSRIGRLTRGVIATGMLTVSAVLSVAAGIAIPVMLAGAGNALIAGSVAAITVGLAGLAIVLVLMPGRTSRALALIPLGLLAVIGAVRPAVPLAERPAVYLAPAGLRTTAGDYLAFLDTAMTSDDPVMQTLFRDTVPVNDFTDWGAGIGVTRSPGPAVWHWGVNYPGYQAFAIAWPETGEAGVVLMSGGRLSPAPDGFRYSGLELAVDALAAGGAPMTGSWWQGIQ
jgi:CubicO group peptidase (beta-lactamase class C family)